MKIFEAKKRITRNRVIAASVMAISAIFFICAALKSMYFSMDGDTSAFSSVSQAVQRFVYFIYEKTQFASWFWGWAPIINPKELNTTGNYGFLFIALSGAIGRVMWDSAANLSLRIAKTIKRVEELGWEQELMAQQGSIQSSKPDLLQINIELDQKDQWYKRPVGLVLLGVAIAVLAQIANLHFGLSE